MTVYRPLKVALLGEIRAGKDTVAQIITDELAIIKPNKNTVSLAFANGIHEAIRLFFPEAYLIGKPRKHLQKIGQWFRELNPDIWVDRLFNSYDYRSAKQHGLNILITDVRQPNEAKRLMAEGFTVIKVVADFDVRVARAKAEGDSFDIEDFYHETETIIQQCDYSVLIDNSSTYEALENRVKEVIEEVVKNGK